MINEKDKNNGLGEEVLAKIRWTINFIAEELDKVEGSPDIKKEILNNCSFMSNALSKCCNFNVNREKAQETMKPALNKFDETIKKIDGDKKNTTLFMLLITHIADIKFLLLSEEEQKRIIDAIKKNN